MTELPVVDADSAAALQRYRDSQGDEVAAIRAATEMPEWPWPAIDDPMLSYLLDRAHWTADHEGVRTAVTWLATHAWYEGALAERARTIAEGAE